MVAIRRGRGATPTICLVGSDRRGNRIHFDKFNVIGMFNAFEY